jgi:hypothetical protein
MLLNRDWVSPHNGAFKDIVYPGATSTFADEYVYHDSKAHVGVGLRGRAG